MTGAELENAPMMLDGAATDGSIAPRSTSRPAVRDSLSQVDLTIVGAAPGMSAFHWFSASPKAGFRSRLTIEMRRLSAR